MSSAPDTRRRPHRVYWHPARDDLGNEKSVFKGGNCGPRGSRWVPKAVAAGVRIGWFRACRPAAVIPRTPRPSSPPGSAPGGCRCCAGGRSPWASWKPPTSRRQRLTKTARARPGKRTGLWIVIWPTEQRNISRIIWPSGLLSVGLLPHGHSKRVRVVRK
jgi:hypothetical protein